MNKEIPVPDPFSKEYEYFFPSASWEEICSVPMNAEKNNYSENIFPSVPEIDVKIPEQ